METKTSQAKALYNAGKFKDAYRILKTFKLGLTKEEIRAIQITYECMCGKSSFYARVGVSVVEMEQQAEDAIKTKIFKLVQA